MSGLAGGLILIPLALMILPAIRGGMNTSANASSYNATRYEEQQRRRREEIRRSGMNESIGSYRSNMAANMNEQNRLNVKASEEMVREMERTQRNLISLTENDQAEDFQQFMGQVQSSRKNFTDSMFRIQDRAVTNYQTKINESMNEITRTINGQYATYLSELQNLNSNIQAKQERARQVANDYIEEAKVLLVSLEQDYEGAKYSGPRMTELQSQLNKAIGQYNLQNYEASLATAKDVSISVLEEIYRADCKSQEWDNYHKMALTIAAELEAFMDEMAVISTDEKRKIEDETGKPLEEEIVGIKISDYSFKTKDGKNQFEYLTSKIKEIKAFLESEDAKALTTEQLKGYIDTLNNQLYPAATSTVFKAVMNMNNAFSRQNISEEIIDFFEEHNFSFKGYSYDEDKHDGALHIGLENEATGEEIIVTLAPELVQNGEVQTRVEIDQLMGDETNEERKAFYRESVEGVVVGNTPGAQIKIECNKEFKNKLSNKTELRDRLK